MARPKNLAHRDALLDAATRTIAADGLAVSTATIAKEAGVSAGTLFVHFDTKAALVNELYVSLKTGMARVATQGMADGLTPREQLQAMWNNWIAFATTQPRHQRALAHLTVADELTQESHQAVSDAYADIARLLQAITSDGPMRDVPLGFVTALMSAMTDATIDDLIAHPDPSGARRDLAFDALWRALAG